ncbi:MAG: IS110 family transposase [Syntrophus sp. (in: bacteria)]|nr:IS110 family transposase [Syntrophus sp. (in: bacteria)]
MVKSSLIGEVGDGSASGVEPRAKRRAASRAVANGRREIDCGGAFKAVSERDPRRRRGINPNSRWSRRHPASSHLQTREITMSEPIYVGIDVGKDTLHVAACPTPIHACLPNTAEGHRQLCRMLQKHTVALVVMEATGGYERPVAAELLAEALPVVVINPRQVRDFARGMGQRAKTDAIDAQVLASFAQIVKPAPKPQFKAKTAELAELVKRRRQLNDLRTQENNRILMIHHHKVKKSIAKMIKTLDFQIAEIEQLIRDYIDADDDFKTKDGIIQSAPGVGPQTAAMLLSHLPELGQLNRQEIASMAGLAPWDHASGKSAGKAHIWGGRKEVRNVLYMAALAARRCNPVIRAMAERLTHAGKPFKVVMTACMRKLLIILNTMIRNQTSWTPKLN